MGPPFNDRLMSDRDAADAEDRSSDDLSGGSGEGLPSCRLALLRTLRYLLRYLGDCCSLLSVFELLLETALLLVARLSSKAIGN